MPYTLSSNLESEKNTLHGAGPMVWLFEMQRDSSNTSYYCRERADVTFNSQTYAHKSISFEPPEADSAGRQHSFKISISNVDQVEVAYLEAGKYLNQPVTVRHVSLNYLSSAADQVIHRGLILSATVTRRTAIFSCGAYNLRGCAIPHGRIYRTRCRWRFKDDACGYAGGETECDLTIETCRDTMSNEERFGGAPGLPILRP